MTDAVKMALIDNLRVAARASASSVETCQLMEDAADALEQAGEPVAKLHYSGDVMEAVQQLLERGRATLDSEGYLVAHPAEAPLPTLQRLGQEFDAPPIKQPLTTAADAGVTQEDRVAAEEIGGFIASWHEFNRSDDYEQGCEAAMRFRLQSVAAATAGMPTIWEDPAGKGYPCFERPMTPAEARATIDLYEREIARMQEALTAIAEQQEHEIALDPDWPRRIARAALSEAREAGDSIAAGDRV